MMTPTFAYSWRRPRSRVPADSTRIAARALPQAAAVAAEPHALDAAGRRLWGGSWRKQLIGTTVPAASARDPGRVPGFALAHRLRSLYTELYGSVSASPPGCHVCRALRRHPAGRSGAARAGGRFDHGTCRDVPDDPHRDEEAHGFITDVKMLPLKSAGRINAKTGFTEMTVYYKANSCKPTIGETMTAQIQRTTKLGMHLKCGPFKLFMHEKMLPTSFSYTEDAFKCAKTGRILQAGVEVVVEIVGTSWTDGEYMIIVTLV